MTEALKRYRQLEHDLWMTRWRHGGAESTEEDAILDEMDTVAMNLSGEEQSLLRREGPRCWPMDSLSRSPELAGTAYDGTLAPWPYEGFRSPADAILSTDTA